MGKMFEQTAIPVEHPEIFDPVKAAIEAAFSSSTVDGFLKRVEQSKLRVRDFEHVLEKGLLGDAAKSGYAQLGASDRGQVRELYLRAVEHVPLELRGKHLKVYAYY